jgi:outer membrane protein assembly factor BamE
MLMRIKILLLVLLLSSCALAPYKSEVRQGNLILSEMRERVKLGMSEVQARAALGTPLVNDVFHTNRWDYLYRLERGGKLLEDKRLTLYFEAGKLARIEDDEAMGVAK